MTIKLEGWRYSVDMMPHYSSYYLWNRHMLNQRYYYLGVDTLGSHVGYGLVVF